MYIFPTCKFYILLVTVLPVILQVRGRSTILGWGTVPQQRISSRAGTASSAREDATTCVSDDDHN